MKRTLLLISMVAGVMLGCRKTETPSATQQASTTETTATVAGVGETTTTEQPAESPEATRQREIASKLATYSAMRFDGTTWNIGAENDKVVLLNVWATWCGPCVYEIPELKKLQAELGPRGLEIVGVSVDEKAMEADVRQFVKDRAIDYPIVLDPEGRISMLLESSGIPTSVLIDRKGDVVWYQLGVVQGSDPALQEALGKALGE